MSTVNDLMKYLNRTLSLGLPVLPLNRWTRALTALWKARVSNWTADETPPPDVQVELPEPLNIPVAGATLQMSQAHILIAQIPAPTPSAQPTPNPRKRTTSCQKEPASQA